MEYKIPFISDGYLQQLKESFYVDLLIKYKRLEHHEQKKSNLLNQFSAPRVQDSEIAFIYTPLLLGEDEEEDLKYAAENIRRLYDSLRNLTVAQATMEKIWVALLNTHYLDYHLHVIESLRGKKDSSQLIWDRTFVSGRNGDKRHLMMNNLSLLWWIGYYTHDKEDESNPYHLTEFFTSTAYRGNAIALFSSNIHGNREITLGILDGIKKLVEDGVIKLNRYAYSNSSKIINIVSGVSMVDLMTREDVRDIIITELPKSDNIQLA